MTDDVDARSGRRRAPYARRLGLHRSAVRSGMREVSAVLAHDLSQPLTALLSYSTAPAPADAEGLRESMGRIAAEATRAADRLGALKDAIRRSRRPPVAVDVNDIVREVVELFEDEIAEERVELRLELDPEPPAVEGDGAQIRQALSSLVENALEAIGDGDRRTIEIRTIAAGGDVELTVADSGCGVPAEAAERLFERFFTTKPDALGLGLAIAKSIVQGHGGHIWSRSGREGGTTFGIRLPALPGGAKR